jgi:hypothetical protein
MFRKEKKGISEEEKKDIKKESVGVLDRKTYQGVPEVDDCGGDRQTWNSKVCVGTRDIRFI